MHKGSGLTNFSIKPSTMGKRLILLSLSSKAHMDKGFSSKPITTGEETGLTHFSIKPITTGEGTGLTHFFIKPTVIGMNGLGFLISPSRLVRHAL